METLSEPHCLEWLVDLATEHTLLASFTTGFLWSAVGRATGAEELPAWPAFFGGFSRHNIPEVVAYCVGAATAYGERAVVVLQNYG